MEKGGITQSTETRKTHSKLSLSLNEKTQVYCYKLYLNQFNIIFNSIIHSLFNRFNIYIERYKQINIF